MRIWDLERYPGQPLQLALNDTGSGYCTRDISPDGRFLATMQDFDDRRIHLWDTHAGKHVRVLDGHGSWIRVCVFTRDGKHLVTGGDDRSVRLWKLDSGECLRVLEVHRDQIAGLGVTSDGKYMAIGSGGGCYDHTAQLWDLTTGNQIGIFTGHNEVVWSLAFSPDGSEVATASGDNTVRLWDVASRRCIRVLEPHKGYVRTVAFTPDGGRIVTAADGGVDFWDRVSGELLGTVRPLEKGFLWTSPPDESAGAPSGWLWTDRPDLVHLTEANKDGSGDPKPISQDDQRFRDYMFAYNRQDMVMARINDPQRYKELTGLIKPLLNQRGRDATHLALPGPDGGTVPQAPPSDDQ
jgi:WD40 repeat protein